MKKIAVVLSGCGNKDGTEITEAVSLIIELSKANVDVKFFAPNLEFKAQNFLTDQEPSTTRNMMVEAARITRSEIADLTQLNPDDFDGLAFPGGYGAALNLCEWSTKGSKGKVLKELDSIIKKFHEQSKPIAAICIAPVLLALSLGHHGIVLTIGNHKGEHKEAVDEILKTGAEHENCPVDDYVTDRHHKVITTPAYMYEARPHQVYNGIAGLVKEFVEMA
jgi:enhancing lycopene biosynthesis protein 2